MKIYSQSYFLLGELMRIPYRLFYRKIRVIGRENIPKNKPVIFAPNHQNALMDPLAMIYSNSKQIVFLARGDVFMGGVVNKVLNFLKILPVYRQHDGKKALKKNDAIFDQSVDYLEQNGRFCLFPEAIHNPHRNLRALKKGIPRIAFMALDKSDNKLDIQIIPTGIYYEDKNSSDSYLQIQYGKQIAAKDYIEQIKENEQKAMSQLSIDMAPHIKSLIIDIKENEDYYLVENIRAIYSDRLMNRFGIICSDENRFKMDQQLLNHIKGTSYSDSFKQDISELKKQLLANNWTFRTLISKPKPASVLGRLLVFLLLFPIALQGLLINSVLFLVIRFIRASFIKDPQFISSINYIIGSFLSPIYFSILALISFIFIDWQYSVLVFVLLPFTSYLSYFYFKRLTILKQEISYKWSFRSKEIEILKKKIFKQLDLMFEDFKN